MHSAKPSLPIPHRPAAGHACVSARTSRSGRRIGRDGPPRVPAGHANTRDGVRVVVIVVVVVNRREPEELWRILSTQRRFAVTRRSSDHDGVTEHDAGEPEGDDRLDSHRVPGDDGREGYGGRSGGGGRAR